MKKIIAKVFLFVLFATAVIRVYLYTNSIHYPTTEVVVMSDITDAMLVKPNKNDAESFFDLNKNRWNGAMFKLVDISDVSFNRSQKAGIEAENDWLSNEAKRIDKVNSFYSNVEQIFNDVSKMKTGKDNTSIYVPISQELNILSESKAENKIMLVYSDLMQNTYEISFYNSETLNSLSSKADSVSKYFESQVVLKNLNGITIYFVYQPLNIGNDEEYKIVSKFFKNIFESKGAKVIITAGIDSK
ncbi:MAG: hypothetical protein WC223_11705 [Bacteroidales bacterium]|jgi:hypothetical protein